MGKVGGSPDHHKVSNHSEPEAWADPRLVSRGQRTGWPAKKKEVRGEVEIASLA